MLGCGFRYDHTSFCLFLLWLQDDLMDVTEGGVAEGVASVVTAANDSTKSGQSEVKIKKKKKKHRTKHGGH